MSVWKNWVGDVYTKTVITDAALAAIKTDRSLGLLLIERLRANATLVIHDWSGIKGLPTQLRETLKDDLVKERIRSRHIPDVEWTTLDDAAVEVRLEDSPSHDGSFPIRTDIASFSDVPRVSRRAAIRSGETPANNREEFWTQCLLPVIESTKPLNRRILLIDQYAIHDMRKSVYSHNGNLVESRIQNSGLVWLLCKINSMSMKSGHTAKVDVVAAESFNLELSTIRPTLNEVVNRFDHEGLDLTFRIVRERGVNGRPDGFIARRLMINNSYFTLSHGCRDLSLPRDQAPLTGTFTPKCGQELRNSLNQLAQLPQEILRVSQSAK